MKKIDRTGETNIATNKQKITIIEYRNLNDFDVRFEDDTIVKNKRYDAFKRGNIKNPNYKYKNIRKNKTDRINKTNIAKNGQRMTIIEYRKCNDIDIKFEDGTIVKHKSYNTFQKGEIKNPNLQHTLIKKDKVNETNIATNGQKMTIIKYQKYNDIDVQFEDGSVVTHKDYKSFKKGNIKNPNCIVSGISYNELFCLKQLEQFGFKKSKKGELKHLGLGRLELDLYNSELKIGIEYDGGGGYIGEKRSHTIEKDMKKDLLCEQAGITLYRIREPQLPKYNNSSIKFYLIDNSQGSQNLIDTLKLIVKDINERFNTQFNYKYKKQKIEIGSIYQSNKGKINIATNGQKMTIIKYRKYSDIDVQFEDGTIVKHKNYGNFKKGTIQNPNFILPKKTRIKYKDRINEINIAKNGEKMTIIEYRNANDIDVMFEDGTIITHRQYTSFKKGNIEKNKKNRKGEVNIAKNGQRMTIIEYRNANDIDIQFEDGTIVKHRQYTSFKKGTIQNPNFNKILKLKNNRKGETNTANNGQVMTIVEYRNVYDIDVMFEDNIIVKHKTYRNFKIGEIKNPNLPNTQIIKNQKRKGETNGQKITIIEYRKTDDIDVQFEDGTIVENKSYRNFKKGYIKNSNYKKKTN